MEGRARCRRAGRLQPQQATCGRCRGSGAPARRWQRQSLRLDRGHDRRSHHRRDLALRTQSGTYREYRRDRRRRDFWQRQAQRHCVRETSGSHCSGSEEGCPIDRECGNQSRLSRESDLCAPCEPRARVDLGPRRCPHRAPVPRPRCRGTQRSPHAVVLARQPAGWRSAQRHDVSLRRSRASLAHETGLASFVYPTGEDHSPHSQPQVDAAGIHRAAVADDGQGCRLQQAPFRRLRQRHDRIRGGRRLDANR